MRVGSGIGPRTSAPVRFAVLTISFVELSSTRWSNAFRRMRIVWPAISYSQKKRRPVRDANPHIQLLYDPRDDTRAYGAATLADRETKFLFHSDRHDELNFPADVITR